MNFNNMMRKEAAERLRSEMSGPAPERTASRTTPAREYRGDVSVMNHMAQSWKFPTF